MTLPAAIANDIAALLATQSKAESAKRKLTDQLKILIAQFNDARTPRSTLISSLSAFVTQFNELTTQTNALWKALDVLSRDAAVTNSVELTAAPIVLSPPTVSFK